MPCVPPPPLPPLLMPPLPPPEFAPLIRGTSLDSALAGTAPLAHATGGEGSRLGASSESGSKAGKQHALTPRGVAEMAARAQPQAKTKGVAAGEQEAGEDIGGGDVESTMPGAPPAGFLKPPLAHPPARGLPPTSDWPHFPIMVP